MKKQQNGFTLLEVVIAMTLIVAMTAVVFGQFGHWRKFQQQIETDHRLQEVKTATEKMYSQYAWDIDFYDDASATLPSYGDLRLNATSTIKSICPADLADSDLVAAEMAPIQSFATKSVDLLAKDGFNNRLCIVVSPRLSKSVGNSFIYYHAIAFVSYGEDGLLAPSTTLAPDPNDPLSATAPDKASWTIVLDGDDRGVLINGFDIQKKLFDISLYKVNKLADAYQTFFKVRYMSNQNRDVSLDYFYKDIAYGPDGGVSGDPQDATAGFIDNTVAATTDMTGDGFTLLDTTNAPNLIDSLGVGSDDVVDGWGNPILVDNYSDKVRSPNNTNPAMRLPPYTSRFGFYLPGPIGQNTQVTATSVGTY